MKGKIPNWCKVMWLRLLIQVHCCKVLAYITFWQENGIFAAFVCVYINFILMF